MKSYRKAVLQGVKAATACACAVWTAELLGLKYAVTAGIIAILSIGGTKKETLTAARNRAVAFLCAIAISAVCFGVFGYHIWAFGIYVLCFITLCLLAGWPEAMSTDSVLISHFFQQGSMSLHWFCNEALLLMIGAGFGFLANSMLRRHSREFELCADRVDKLVVGILSRMSMEVQTGGKEEYASRCFGRLDEALQKAQICAMNNWNNSLKASEFYEIDYVAMRQKQRMVLEEIYKSVIMLEFWPRQAQEVGDFIGKVAAAYHRNNPVGELWQQLDEVFVKMEAEPLPESRQEFEARAVLFYILKQLREFLNLKRVFAEKYPL